ncbi:Uncharacterized protein FWK35_00021081, partial [Aphis craccivora]
MFDFFDSNFYEIYRKPENLQESNNKLSQIKTFLPPNLYPLPGFPVQDENNQYSHNQDPCVNSGIHFYSLISIKHLILKCPYLTEERKIFPIPTYRDITSVKNFNLLMDFLKITNLYNRIKIFH